MPTLTTTIAALAATILLTNVAHALTPADKCEAAVAGDADLVAGNIKNGVDVFGVTGTLLNPQLNTGQTTAYGTGSDGDLQKGVSHSFTDNGEGTITDSTTALMWEKKDRSGGMHDYSHTYTWGTIFSPYTMDGTMVTTFLAALNGGTSFCVDDSV